MVSDPTYYVSVTANLQGDINGKTHNGKVVCLQIQGAVSLETLNGDIDYQQIT